MLTTPKWVPNPFFKDDLKRSSSKGRSLHDLANKFYRDKMNLLTLITKLLKTKDIRDALKSIKRRNDAELF